VCVFCCAMFCCVKLFLSSNKGDSITLNWTELNWIPTASVTTRDITITIKITVTIAVTVTVDATEATKVALINAVSMTMIMGVIGVCVCLGVCEFYWTCAGHFGWTSLIDNARHNWGESGTMGNEVGVACVWPTS